MNELDGQNSANNVPGLIQEVTKEYEILKNSQCSECFIQENGVHGRVAGHKPLLTKKSTKAHVTFAKKKHVNDQS